MTTPTPKQPRATLTRRHMLLGTAVLGAIASYGFLRDVAAADTPGTATETFEVAHTDAEWRQQLTAEQYNVLREEGTERSFSSPLNGEHRAGVFGCAGCGLDLFSSKHQVRQRHRLAEFLDSDGQRRARAQRQHPGHDAHRGASAAAAAAILAMSSTTDPNRPACVTA